MMSILRANFLGHLGWNSDWNIVALLYGLAGTILLGDFLACFLRHLLTRFHGLLEGFLGTFFYWLVYTLLCRLLHRNLLTALLWNSVAVSVALVASVASVASITSVTSINSTTRTDHSVSGLTLLLMGCLKKSIKNKI